jgi:hypothetical protein
MMQKSKRGIRIAQLQPHKHRKRSSEYGPGHSRKKELFCDHLMIRTENIPGKKGSLFHWSISPAKEITVPPAVSLGLAGALANANKKFPNWEKITLQPIPKNHQKRSFCTGLTTKDLQILNKKLKIPALNHY